MNMISTGAFLNEMDASNKQPSVAERFAAVWEKKNAKAARAGGVSLMALSLAACGSSSTTTTSTDTSTDTSTTPTTPVSSNFTTSIDALTGTSGADSFTGDSATVSGADSVAGGAGTDTVALYGTVTLPTLSSIENLELHDNGSTAITMDLSSTALEGVTTLTLDGFAAGGDTITTKAGDTVNFADATTGTVAIASAATVTSVNIGVGGEVGTAAGSEVTFDLNGTGLTTVNVAGTGAKKSYIILDTDASSSTVTTINVTHTGTATLFIDPDEDAETIDASASTGSVQINGDTALADDATIKLGSGDDKVVMAGELDADDTLTGGDGEDTLSITADVTAATGTISGFEVLELADTGTSSSGQTVDVDDAFAGFTKFVISGADTNTAATWLIDDAVSGSHVTVTMDDGADSPEDDTAEISLKTDGTADEISFTIGSATVAAEIGTLKTAEAETVAISLGSKDGHEIQNLTFTDATSVTVSGAGNATMNGINLKDDDSTFDASAATGDLSLTFSDDQDMTMKTGSGDDTINIDADYIDGNDSISMGAGEDTLNLTGGSAAIDVTFDGYNDIEHIVYTRNDGSTGASDTVEFDLREVSGLETITIDGDQADLVAALTLNKVASGATVQLKDIADASSDTHTISAVSGAASLTLQLDGVDNATDDTVVVNNVTALAVAQKAGSEGSNLADLNTGDATSLSVSATEGALVFDDLSTAKLTSVTVSGDNDVTISAGGATTITSIDASGLDATNNNVEFTLGSSSAAVARASTATITGSDGNDNIGWSLASTQKDNVIKAGNNETVSATEGGDTLLISGTMTGNTIIDLSSTTDQVTTWNGNANAAVQTGFEAIDASGATMVGSASFTITGSSGINLIIGDTGADVIDGGGGADYIRGGLGNDTLTGGAGADKFVFHAGSSTDTITDFALGTDKIVLGADASGSDSDVFDAGELILPDTDVSAGTADTNGFGTLTAVSTADYIEAAASDVNTTTDHIIVLTDTTGLTSIDDALHTLGTVDDHADLMVVFYNASSTDVEMYYITDAGDSAEAHTDYVGTKLAVFDNIAASAMSSFTADTFQIELIA